MLSSCLPRVQERNASCSPAVMITNQEFNQRPFPRVSFPSRCLFSARRFAALVDSLLVDCPFPPPEPSHHLLQLRTTMMPCATK